MSAVERFRSGRFAVVEHRGAEVLIGRRIALARVVAVSAVSGALVAYVVAAVVLGLVVQMVAVPTLVAAVLVVLVRRRRSALDARAARILGERDRRARGPIYGAPRPAFEHADEPAQIAPAAPATRGPTFGPVWRDQAAIDRVEPSPDRLPVVRLASAP